MEKSNRDQLVTAAGDLNDKIHAAQSVGQKHRFKCNIWEKVCVLVSVEYGVEWGVHDLSLRTLFGLRGKEEPIGQCLVIICHEEKNDSEALI